MDARQKSLKTFFNPRYGAALEELDYLPVSVNLMCNVQRHKEQYHGLVLGGGLFAQAAGLFSIHQLLGAKEKNLDKQVFYDRFRRLSFMDHFFAAPACAEEFKKISYKEIGDFVGTPFKARLVGADGRARICFEREGSLRMRDKRVPFKLAKLASPDGESGLKVCYHLKNLSGEFLNFTFGVEFNFSIGQKSPPKIFSEKKSTRWVFEDSWRGIEIRLEADTLMDLVTIPIETVSGSEGGLERTYQGLGILLQKGLRLGPRQTRQFVVNLQVG
jgi:alpha-amylase